MVNACPYKDKLINYITGLLLHESVQMWQEIIFLLLFSQSLFRQWRTYVKKTHVQCHYSLLKGTDGCMTYQLEP